MNRELEMVPAILDWNIDIEPGPFLCKICSKAFTKLTSRNRHVLYCRKKLGSNLPVVRKSCAACRKAKAKCNSEFPTCRRCGEKELICVYELTRRSADLAHQPSFDGTLPVASSEHGNRDEISWAVIPNYEIGAFSNSEADQLHTQPTALEDCFSQSISTFDWEPDARFVEELEASELSTSSSSNFRSPLDLFSLTQAPSLNVDPTFSTPADCMFHTPYLILRPMDLDRSSPSSSLISPRSPFIHASLSTGSQIGRTFILHNIQSYATILAASTLPPFIHSTSIPFPDTYQSRMPTCAAPPTQPTLEICKSIISLYTTKTPSTSSFVWRTITMEKDRFMNEYLDGDEWTVLSMLQAITLYILLRIFDHDSFSADFDRELVRAMTEIAIKSEQCRLICHAEVEGTRPEWKEWVLVESKRRTVTLLFILYLLFDIKPEQRAKSKVGLSVLPLPAHRNLWEAKTEDEWVAKYDQMLTARNGRCYLRYADLMELSRSNGDERMQDLSAWMISGDAFGILVMMAATTL